MQVRRWRKRVLDSAAVTPTAPPADGSVARQQNFDSKSKAFDKTLSADTKSNFWGFVGQVGSILDNTATGISVNPTLDKIFTKSSADWLKRVQINFTPVTKTNDLFKVDSLSVGFTVAIINNYTQHQWQNLDVNPLIQRYRKLMDILILSAESSVLIDPGKAALAAPKVEAVEKAVVAKTIKPADIDALDWPSKFYILKRLTELKGDIPESVWKDKTLAKFLNGKGKSAAYQKQPPVDTTNPSPADAALVDKLLADEFNDAFDVVDAAMNKKQQLNFPVSVDENFVTHRWQGIYFTPNYTNYFGGVNRRWSYSIKGAFSFEVDTLHPTEGFERKVLKLTPDIDWLPHINDPDLTKTSFLELENFRGI